MAKSSVPPSAAEVGPEEPLIITYTNLLHQYRDPDAEPVREFVRQHAEDAVFLRRAEVLNRVFRLKEELMRPL